MRIVTYSSYAYKLAEPWHILQQALCATLGLLNCVIRVHAAISGMSKLRKDVFSA